MGTAALIFLFDCLRLSALQALWTSSFPYGSSLSAVTPSRAMDYIYTQGKALPHIGAITRIREKE